jgi:hypothetical protein
VALASLFVQASRGIARGGADDLAAATKKIFEGRWVLDATYGAGASQSLAMVEDVAWFDDALRLASDRASAGICTPRTLFMRDRRRLSLTRVTSVSTSRRYFGPS